MRYEQVIASLLASIPEFRQSYDGLLSAFGDEEGIGNHLAVGGLFTFMAQTLRKEQPDEPLVTRICSFVEEMASSTEDEVQNLVVVSFFEHMWQLSKAEQDKVIRNLGPSSAQLLRLSDLM